MSVSIHSRGPRVGRRVAGVVSVAALAAATGLAPGASAAPITWGAATAVTADTDVSTAGTRVMAYNFGDSTVAAATINGVTFDAFAFSPSASPLTVGNATVTPVGGLLSSSAPASLGLAPAGVSTSYQFMLAGTVLGLNAVDFDLKMSNLTIGKLYQFQWWSNSPGGTVQILTTATAADGGSVTLQSNPAGLVGAVGEFATGTFTADATSETIHFTGINPFFNTIASGFQLRELQAAPPPGGGGAGNVPLPAAVWAGLALGAGVIARARRVGVDRA